MRYMTNFYAAAIFIIGLSNAASARDEDADEIWVDHIRNVNDLYEAGEIDDAVTAAREALDFALYNYGPEDDHAAASLHCLAHVLVLRKNRESAELFFEQVLAVSEEDSREDDFDIALCQGDSGDPNHDQSEDRNDESLMALIGAAVDVVRGHDRPDMMHRLYDLAPAHQLWGRIDKAGVCYNRMAAIVDGKSDPVDAIFGSGGDAWARFWLSRKHVNHADSLFGRAVNDFRIGRFSDSSALSNRADSLETSEKPKKSQSIFKRAFGTFKNLLGLGQSDQAVNVVNLANLYCGQGKAQAGAYLLRQLLDNTEGGLNQGNSVITFRVNSGYGVFDSTFGAKDSVAAVNLNDLVLLLLQSLEARGRAVQDDSAVVIPTGEFPDDWYRTSGQDNEADNVESPDVPNNDELSPDSG